MAGVDRQHSYFTRSCGCHEPCNRLCRQGTPYIQIRMRKDVGWRSENGTRKGVDLMRREERQSASKSGKVKFTFWAFTGSRHLTYLINTVSVCFLIMGPSSVMLTRVVIPTHSVCIPTHFPDRWFLIYMCYTKGDIQVSDRLEWTRQPSVLSPTGPPSPPTSLTVPVLPSKI